jgi:hypothetical protein
VIPNYELKKMLLSFGERIEVLAPAGMRKTLSEASNKLNQLYSAG